MVALLGLATGMMLLALVALDGPAQARPRGAPDLSVKKTPTRAKLVVGRNFTWTVRVTNQRGGVARNVVMVDDLPGFVRFVRARTSLREPGICRPLGRSVVQCRLGNLRVDKRVTIKVTGRALTRGSGKNRVHVHSGTRTGAGFARDLQRSDNIDTTRHRAVRRS